ELGIVVAQYVGGALLVAGLTAVGVWASSVSQNQITAFIVGVFVMFLLIFVGLDQLLVGLPPRLGAIAGALGVLSHFSQIARGVIDLRDAVYFVTLAALFLVLAYFSLLARKLTARGEALKRLRLGTVLLAVAVVVVNLFGRNIGGRLDLSPGRAFTLAPATRQLLRTLPDLVTIRLFASSALPKAIESTRRDRLVHRARCGARPAQRRGAALAARRQLHGRPVPAHRFGCRTGGQGARRRRHARLAQSRPARAPAGVPRTRRQPARDGDRHAALRPRAVRLVAAGGLERAAPAVRRLDRLRHGV